MGAGIVSSLRETEQPSPVIMSYLRLWNLFSEELISSKKLIFDPVDLRDANPMKTLAQGLIRIYQRGISCYLPTMCRYEPSCSEYGYQAIGTYGIWTGFRLTLNRLGRCHPFGGRGFDPVP